MEFSNAPRRDEPNPIDSSFSNSSFNEVESLRQFKKLQSDFYREVLSNDYTLGKIVSLCENAKYSIEFLSSAFCFSKSKDNYKTIKNKFKNIIHSVSELLDANKQDSNKLVSLPESSSDSKKLLDKISKRTEEATAIMLKVKFREAFMFNTLYRGLEDIVHELQSQSNNASDDNNVFLMNFHQGKSDFIKYFQDLLKTKNAYFKAKENLFKHYEELILTCSKSLCEKLPSEDAFQEAFLGFNSTIETYEPSKSRLQSFTFALVRNITFAIKQAKKRALEHQKLDDIDDIFNSDIFTTFDSEIFFKEKYEIISDIFDKLFKYLPDSVSKYQKYYPPDYKNRELIILERNIEIFKYHFGLIDRCHSLAETSIKFNISRERARQICEDIMIHFHEVLKNPKFVEEIKRSSRDYIFEN